MAATHSNQHTKFSIRFRTEITRYIVDQAVDVGLVIQTLYC